MIPPALKSLIESENPVSKLLGVELSETWLDFSKKIDNTKIIRDLVEGRSGLVEYKRLMVGMRAQIVDGGSWIARAASSFDAKSSKLAAMARTSLIGHANEEKADYRMIDADYCAVGGLLEDIEGAEQNIATHALSSYIMWIASQPNPFGFLGAVMIIEGMGTVKAQIVAEALQHHLKLKDNQVSFLRYHAKADDDHFVNLVKFLSNPLITESIAKSIIKTAKTVAFLYQQQLAMIDPE